VKLSDKDKAVEGVDISDQSRIAIKSKKIYLRIDGDFNPSKDIATFYYSTDGKKWEKTGIDFKMRFDYRRFFMGTKYAIFNYATKALGGYIDIDNFSFRKF
jgi:beta-xylosidase